MSVGKPAQLFDFWQCFEGVIPAVVATAARDGTPNVSYISQVFYIDEQYVALSNQFMSKTVSNILENPRAQVVLIDPCFGRQLVLDLMFDRAETSGTRFAQFDARISAISAHRGMEKVMRLRSADIYRVLDFTVQSVDGVPAPFATSLNGINLLGEAASLSTALAHEEDLDQSIEMVLGRLQQVFGMRNCMILLADGERAMLTALASRGYDSQGAGAEVAWGQGVIGMAAERACSMRFSNVGRHFMLADNIDTTQYLSSDRSRTIPLPGLQNPQSLLAIPMIAVGEVRGVIYAESEQWLAFSPHDEQALSLIASQLAVCIALAETTREFEAVNQGQSSSKISGSNSEKDILVHCHTYDDSLFINHDYVIKGVPARILWRMLQIYCSERRTEFTNREFRLDATLKLPEFKDNLETRLLLLSRRLSEKVFPVRINRTGRGRIELVVEGKPILTQDTSS